MSIGFSPPRTEPPRPSGIVLWRVRKDTRAARAFIRVYPHGRELFVMNGDALVWSRLFRTDEDSRELGSLAAGTLADFRTLRLDASPRR